MSGTDHTPGLGERQAALVAALVADSTLPPGFDPARLAAARGALLRKRAARAAEVWPILAAALGPGWFEAFSQVVAGRPPTGGLRDGWDVARALESRGELPLLAADELRDRERRWRYDGRRAPRRRWGRILR